MASPQWGSFGTWSHDPLMSRLVGAVGRRWWALPTPTSERGGQGGADGEGRTGRGGQGQTPASPEDGRVALMSRRRAGPREGGRPVCSFGTDVPGSPSAWCALATALYVCSLN